ncbi:uncharacterized protein LOC126835231 [Adelges cooleyi]|uniref:uncharacterized protein LOC126835231 n=1 Tax=Adelges cooleyi TaxID=133065 RepID=UPI00217FFBDF|nr:uncharacterized protein LOC126835231 [Adelges cooleyi]
MHLKSAVIFCALYFVTTTQSVGLNRGVINRIAFEFKAGENTVDYISPNKIMEIVKQIGVEDLSEFTYEPDTKDGLKVQKLLVLLAKHNKKSDHWLKRRFATHEVTIYLNLFRYHDKHGGDEDGLLDFEELKNVVKALSLNEDEKERLANPFEGDLTINFAEFLSVFVDIKPVGNGLEESQIDELILIKDDKVDGDFISATKITEFILGLSIINDHDENLVFDRIQNSAFELQELVLVAAEYNRTADKNTRKVYSSEIVKKVIAEFHKFDKDKNGKLCKEEAKDIEKSYFLDLKHVGSLIDTYDTDKDEMLDDVELFKLMFKECVNVA